MAVVEVETTARSCEGGHLGRPLLEARQPAEGAEAHVDDVGSGERVPRPRPGRACRRTTPVGQARPGTALHPSVNVVEAGGQVDRHPLVPVPAVGSLLKRAGGPVSYTHLTLPTKRI